MPETSLRLGAGIAFLAAVLAAVPAWPQQRYATPRATEAEIAPFRLTGMEGWVLLRYLRDDTDHRQPAGDAATVRSLQAIDMLRVEVFLMTHSYVYHPAFLTIDLGGGPVIDSGASSADGVATRSNKALYNLDFRADFLKEKPVRGSVFYQHLNPTQSVGIAQVLLSENTRYGALAGWYPAKSAYNARVEAVRSETKGRSAEQTMDDRLDQVTVNAGNSYGKLGDTQFRYQGNRQDSLSGSVGIPIQATRSNTDYLTLDTRLHFGDRSQYDFTNSVAFTSYRYTSGQGQALSDSKDLLFRTELWGRPSETLQTYARYNLAVREANDRRMTLNALGAGATWQVTRELSGTAAVQGDFNDSTELRFTRLGANGSVNYRRPVGIGELLASGSLAFFGHDQTASQSEALVVGERTNFVGTAFYTLARPQVVPGSVVVSNTSRTQVFAEGRDYLLSVVGLGTRIQRTVDSNIADGQEVLIDYAYDAGGTYALRQADSSASLTWYLDRSFSVYARFSDSSPRIVSGTPTSPLNPSRNSLVGARADVPLKIPGLDDAMVGGFLEREDRRETISPGRRTAYEAYFQAALPYLGHGTFRLGTRRSVVDYDLNPLQGVDLVGYDARVSTRFRGGLEISLDATRERDTGQPLARERNYLAARAQWRVRQFSMSFDLTRTLDAQGPAERRRFYGTLALRRDF